MLRPSLQAFTALARVIEITFPNTPDTMFDPIYEIGIGLDELPVESVAGGEKAVQPIWVDSHSYCWDES